MNKLQKKLIVFFIIALTTILYSCDGIFPTSPKSILPADHSNNISGVLHKGTGNELKPDECDDCHTLDLRGKISVINGVKTWAPSCYQCHGALWNRNGLNGNNGY